MWWPNYCGANQLVRMNGCIEQWKKEPQEKMGEKRKVLNWKRRQVVVKVEQKNKYPCTLVEIQSCWLNPPSDIDGDWDELWSDRWPRPPVLPHLPNSPFITFFHPLSAPQCRWRRKWNIFLSSLSASEGSTWMEWDGNCRKLPIIITRGYLINISNCWVSKYFFSLLLCGWKFPKNLLLIGIFQSTTRWWHKNFQGINITLIIGHEKFQQQFFQETPRRRSTGWGIEE